MVIGPQTYHRLPELVRRVEQGGAKIVLTEFPEEDKFSVLPARQSRRSPTAFLTVQEGCDKFCTFCVVPYTRGAEFSRPAAEVIAEAKRLASFGVREVTLLGQNVNAYSGAGADGREWSLARLLEAVAAIPGLDRLRYTTSHPADMSDDLIAAHRDIPELMPYLHLPFQAGADRILAEMNRKHTAADYLHLVDSIRAACPEIALSTDIIVGFPGETDAEFEATLQLVRQVTFAQAYSFKYSPRPGTPAASMDNHISDAVKSQRLGVLQELLSGQQHAFNRSQLGRKVPVLLEKKGRKFGQLAGRSPFLQAVHVNAPEDWIGKIVSVNITHTGANSLSGVIISETDSAITPLDMVAVPGNGAAASLSAPIQG